jgi:hypothetical protein
VKKIFDNDAELLGTAAGHLCGQEQLRQDPSPELIKKKLRKRRSDARYATRAERQAAYRARLKEKRHPHMQQLPALSNPDSRSPANAELIGNGLPVPVAETDSQCADKKPLT